MIGFEGVLFAYAMTIRLGIVKRMVQAAALARVRSFGSAQDDRSFFGADRGTRQSLPF